MKCKQFFCTLICTIALTKADTPHAQEQLVTFIHDLQRYYWSAGWICKEFARMDVTTFTLAWHQVSDFLASANERWFYAHNDPREYAQQRTHAYSTIERYMHESRDMFWITECRAYHAFLHKYAVDVGNNRLIEKKDLPPVNDARADNFVPLPDFIAQYDSNAFINFYQFFFEQLVNVILRQLNYLYEEPQLISAHATALARFTIELEEIYHLCCHKAQPAAHQARALAYHYERTQSVIQSTIMRLLAQLEDEAKATC